MRKRVYIAGPITNGDKAKSLSAVLANVERAESAGVVLLEQGYAPMIPHTTARIPCAFELPYEGWMETDFAWITVAQALVRLPGDSAGADREVEYANSLGIPVHYGMEAFLESEKINAA